jgi:hypothetical protein
MSKARAGWRRICPVRPGFRCGQFTPALRLVLESLADHLGDARAHGDAVEGVGDLHRALLVRDDEQLALLPQLLEERNEPAQVDVVEGASTSSRCRTGWAGPGRSRTSMATEVSERSPPESSDSRLIFLPGGRASTSTPVVSMSSGSVSTSRPSPPGKSTWNTAWNSRAVSSKADVKTSRIRSSTSLTR